MKTIVTFPASLLRRPTVTEPLREGLPVPLPSFTPQPAGLLAESVADLRSLHTLVTASFPPDSPMAQVGALLAATLSAADDETAAMLSPIVQDFRQTLAVPVPEPLEPMASLLLSAGSATVQAASDGFEEAQKAMKASASAQVAAQQSMSFMLLRGYEALLPLLSASAQKIARGGPLAWRSFSVLLNSAGVSDGAAALDLAASRSLDLYSSLTAQALSTHAHLRRLEADRETLSRNLAQTVLWAGLCAQAQRSSPPSPAEAVRNVRALYPDAEQRAKNYLRGLEKTIETTVVKSATKALGLHKPKPPGTLPKAYGGIPVEALKF